MNTNLKLEKLILDLAERGIIDREDYSTEEKHDFFTTVKTFIEKEGYDYSAIMGELTYDSLFVPWKTLELVEQCEIDIYDIHTIYKFDDIYIKFTARYSSFGSYECDSIEQVFPKKIEKTVFEATKEGHSKSQ